MGCGPPLKGKIMEFTLAEEAEYLEQENLKANQALAHPGPDAVVIEAQAVVVKVEPVAEITKIIEFKDRIAAYMAPALDEELKAVAEAATVIKHVTTPEEREAAQKHATACQKGRTLKVEAPFKEFKAPVTAVGKLFDKRKNDLSALVQTEENRIRGLIDQYDQAEAEKQAALERIRKAKVSGRINDLASKGLPIDTEFAEVATDGEWELHVANLVKEKEESDRKAREEQARKDAAQKRIVDRMEIASKLGATLDRDDAEFLSDEAFEEERDKWVIAYNQREEEATRQREEADLVKRAGEAGFALQQCDIDQMRVMISGGQFADIEAAFMLWLDDSVKHKAINDAKLLAAARLEKRMAQVEEFSIEAAISVLRNATDEEWDSIVAAAKPAPVEVPVAPMHAGFNPSKAPIQELAHLNVSDVNVIQAEILPPKNPATFCTPELVDAVDVAKNQMEESKYRFVDPSIALPESGEIPVATLDAMVAFMGYEPITLRKILEDVTNIEFDDHRKGDSFWCHFEGEFMGRMIESGQVCKSADWGVEEYELKQLKWHVVAAAPSSNLTELEKGLSEKLDSVREELGHVFQSFKDFGNKHCTKELRADFTVVFLNLKALVERV